MILRGFVTGAAVGFILTLFLGYDGTFGAIFGGLFGLGAGAWLRHEVRKEIASALARYEPSPAFAEAQEGEMLSRVSPPPIEAAAQEQREEVPEPPLQVERSVSKHAHEERGAQAAPSQPSAAPAEHGLKPAYEAVETPEVPQTAQWAATVRAWLFGGNTIVRVGLAILFVGLSFLARYAASIGLFPLELRLALVAVAGIVLLIIGFQKREKRPAFARALQGTGVAVLYLTVFASSRLFELIPILPAFGFMIVFCALGCSLALLQDSRAMAVASFAGGFAVPIVLGGETETPLFPFAYYTILNLAILLIAWRRSWRSLNLLGFFVTFGMATLWGISNYEPQHYSVAQIFLAASVLIYLATAILYAHNTPGKLGNVVDSTLLFGPALAGFGLQVGLVRPYEFGSAFSALAFGAVYISCAAITLRGKSKEMRLLIESMIAIGVCFVTVAVPLALDVRWTSTAWALEGAGAFWIGMRQARWMPRLFGLLLQGVAAAIFLYNLEPNVSVTPIANAGFLGGLMIAIPLLATAWWLRGAQPGNGRTLAERYQAIEHGLREAAFLIGFFFLCLALALEFTRELPAEKVGLSGGEVFSSGIWPLLLLDSVLVAMWGSTQLARRFAWDVAAWPGRVSLPVIAVVFLSQVANGFHVLYAPGWILWLVAFGLQFHLMYLNDAALAGSASSSLRRWYLGAHAGSAWLVTAVLADCLQLGVDRARLWDTSWAGVIFLDSGIAMLLALTVWAGRAARKNRSAGLHWPLRQSAIAYFWVAPLLIAGLVYLGGLIAAGLASGVTDPLPYVPILNPVDLSVGLALAALALWRRVIVNSDRRLPGAELLRDPNASISMGLLAFVLINSIWLRTAHHWLGVDWNAASLFESFVVETGLAILWTVLAMGLMMFAYRQASRIVWLTGAGLLVIVVIKLLLIDLSNVGGWERIVTFIGVGTLMLVTGYFFPLPPRAKKPSAGELPS